MAVKTIYELPQFDTGRYEKAEFQMGGGVARLTIFVDGLPPMTINFHRLRWHEFTAMYNCTAEQIEGSYFKLAEVVPSLRLEQYISEDKASLKAYKELHHYRIYLDETGCHEFFSESVSAT
jgi:hypothetical protein